MSRKMTVDIAPSYVDGERRMLDKYRCTQSLTAPWLVVHHHPAGTKSIAVKMYDVTAKFTHWLAWNVGTHTETSGVNSFGRQHYSAPCPPKDGRTHQYVVTAYALRDVPSEFRRSASVTPAVFDRVVSKYEIGLASASLYYGV